LKPSHVSLTLGRGESINYVTSDTDKPAKHQMLRANGVQEKSNLPQLTKSLTSREIAVDAFLQPQAFRFLLSHHLYF